MTPLEIAREVFPEAEYDDDYLEYVIWNETGYPSFWHIPRDGRTPAECLRMQLIRHRIAIRNNKPTASEKQDAMIKKLRKAGKW